MMLVIIIAYFDVRFRITIIILSVHWRNFVIYTKILKITYTVMTNRSIFPLFTKSST